MHQFTVFVSADNDRFDLISEILEDLRGLENVDVKT